jgi:hypothetical protein
MASLSLYLFPGADRDVPDAFRLYVGEWLAYEWRFDEGEAKGQLKVVRQVCADLVKEYHPRSANALLPAIESCDQPETLRSWALQSAKLSDEAFVTLVTGKPPARVARSRATRPSRRSSKRR